jgi:hypothetical protein
MERDVVLMLSGEGANDAIAGLMQEYGNALTSAELSVVHVTFEEAELNYAVDLMKRGKVRFAVTWLGIGQNLLVTTDQSGVTANLFEHLKVPLVKLHGDLPAYFIDFHRDTPRNSASLYQAQEFIEFRARWLPGACTLASTIPPIAMSPIARDTVPFGKRRSGSLFFLKNGNSPAALEEMWRQRLPRGTAKLARDMAREIRSEVKTSRLLLGEWVSEYLRSRQEIGFISPELVWFFSAQMDDYLRRLKSTMIADALLDFPVYVQGSFWDHVDFAGRKAKLLPGTDVFASQKIVLEALGVIDMSANVDTWPHDRVQRGAGAYALTLTNRQSWLTDRFHDFVDMTFEFEPESISSRISDVLTHRDRYLELAIAFGEEFRRVYPRERFAERICEVADHVDLVNSRRPQLQNFYVWSRY